MKLSVGLAVFPEDGLEPIKLIKRADELLYKAKSHINDLYELVYVNGRIGNALELIREQGMPDPNAEPDRAFIYARAQALYGDLTQALKVYSSIPPSPDCDAERLWGLASINIQMGHLDQAKRLLKESVAKNPPGWLLPHISHTRFSMSLEEGDFAVAYQILEEGIAACEQEQQFVMRWVFEGNKGVLQSQQGFHEEALLSFERAIKHLKARGSIFFTGHFLTNQAGVIALLGDIPAAIRCLTLAEKFVLESGSILGLIFLKLTQGYLWHQQGRLDNADQYYDESSQLLREYSFPIYEVILGIYRADLWFNQGKISRALDMVRKNLRFIQEKNLAFNEDTYLSQEGIFLVRSGAVRQGLEVLSRAAEMAEVRKTLSLRAEIALYQAFGHEELKQREQALERMKKCLAAVEAIQFPQAILSERDVLIPLLLKLVDFLPDTEILSSIIVQLRHPILVKRLTGSSPARKVFFLRTLKVHDAYHYRKQLSRLRNDPDKVVRHTTRLILQSWYQHTNYRVYTLGSFRVFFEGELLKDKSWLLHGVKRLFLFFLTFPDKWYETDAILEVLYSKSDPKRKQRILYSRLHDLRHVLESFHLSDMDYIFFRSRRGAYGFFPQERFWVDAIDFEGKIKQAHEFRLTNNFKEARETYREALALYGGDYLEEFPYEDWLFQKRRYLCELYFRAVMNYASLECDLGNTSEARRVLEDALFKDLSRTDCMILLIQILARMKLTHEAKEWGDRYRQHMKKELNEEPAPEVMALLNQLR